MSIREIQDAAKQTKTSPKDILIAGENVLTYRDDAVEGSALVGQWLAGGLANALLA